MSLLSASKIFLLGLITGKALAQTCESFGVDFQNGGSYFQNSLSTDPFTFVEEFDGCQNDYADNILVDPNGDEYNCTYTPLTPDLTPELSTCPIDKNQLWTGDWSILIISNNGNSSPIAYERDFFLSVGPQSTLTITPTVIVPIPTTTVINTTSIETDTCTTTLSPSTITVASITKQKTKTVTPHRVTTTTTDTVLVVTHIIPTVIVSKSTTVVTASCSIPPHQHQPDPKARKTPTLVYAAALAEPTSAKIRIKGRDVLDDKVKFVEERHARIHRNGKRAPDQPTVTVTDANTSDWPTITTTTTSTSTITVVSTVETTSTLTPPPSTLVSGKTLLPPITVTAPTPTRTITKFAIGNVTKTKTFSTLIIITSTTTPSAIVTSCRKSGGIIV